MSAAPTSGAYLLDTNILIDLSLWHPHGRFSTFWKIMEATLSTGQWVLLDTVVNEILYDQVLQKWCQAQTAKGFLYQLSSSNKARGVVINNTYPMLDQTTQKSQQDPYIVAFAEEYKLILFTREGYRKKPTDPYKIPDVCKQLGVKFLRQPEKFFSAIGYSH